MQQRKVRQLDAEQLKGYALKLLGGRSMSIGELRQKLWQRAENKSDIDGVLAALKDMKVLDDRTFAEHFAGVRKESRGFGRQRALSDLLKKRVAPKVAQQAIEAAYQGSNEAEMIEAYLARKYRTKNLGEMLQDPKELAGVFRRLRGAGFSSGNSIQVLKRYAAQADQLEDTDEPSGEI